MLFEPGHAEYPGHQGVQGPPGFSIYRCRLCGSHYIPEFGHGMDGVQFAGYRKITNEEVTALRLQDVKIVTAIPCEECKSKETSCLT